MEHSNFFKVNVLATAGTAVKSTDERPEGERPGKMRGDPHPKADPHTHHRAVNRREADRSPGSEIQLRAF